MSELCRFSNMEAMRNSEIPDGKPSSTSSVSRWIVRATTLLVWLVALPLMLGVLPWAISLLAHRYGWSDGRPAIWNLFGLLPVIFGAVLFYWVMVLHFEQTPDQVELKSTPEYLLMRGPYRFTRNPMYVAGVLVWLGWTLFYGSVAVLIATIVFWAVWNFILIPWEERTLKAQFGESYLQYKKSVPRWLGKIRG